MGDQTARRLKKVRRKTLPARAKYDSKSGAKAVREASAKAITAPVLAPAKQ
jgi:hypothetical protein